MSIIANTEGNCASALTLPAPRLRIHRVGESVSLQLSVRLYPAVCLHDVGRVSRRRESLRNELIRIQRNRRNQLVELIRREWSRDIRRDSPLPLPPQCLPIALRRGREESRSR